MRLCRNFLLVVVLAVAAGCAQNTRLIEKPTPLSEDVGIHAESQHLSLTLTQVVLPNGPGSWVKDAKWDEYLFTIQNQGEAPLTILGFWLVDLRGIYLKSREEPGRLEDISEALAEEYKSVQVKTAIGLATAAASSSLITGGAVATTGTLATVGPAALLILPVIPYIEFKAREAKELDKANIEKRFVARRLRSLRLADRAALQGSQFFPVVPNPRTLVVEYRTGGTIHELKLPLEKLRGVHEALARKLEAERKKKEAESWWKLGGGG